MAGEIGVIFNIPQPFLVRTKRLSQVIRISHHHFKQMVQPQSEDGELIIANFMKDCKFIISLHIKFSEESSTLGLKQGQCIILSIIILKLNQLEKCKQIISYHVPLQPIEQKEEQQNRETLGSTDAKPEGRTDTSSGACTIRVIIHGHHPTEATSNERLGKLVYLPDSLEDLFCLAEKKLGKRGSTVLMADGSEVEELNALRENDHLFIV
ncbi:hypothetical protein GQ457_08G003930 [Hibiscus cannabinus]